MSSGVYELGPVYGGSAFKDFSRVHLLGEPQGGIARDGVCPLQDLRNAMVGPVAAGP